MKLTKQDIDKVRDIEGFPIGKDEDIIKLSNPPYYTACPNPFIEEFIRKNGKLYCKENDNYKREPFAADVSEGKNTPIYNAHSYHTKVPHKAIMRYILHYTNPGDIVFDGFSGTGMTGVAAQLCENPEADFKSNVEAGNEYVEWGARKAVINDISPIASFISYNYNTPVDIEKFESEARRILIEAEKECGWMYETNPVLNEETQQTDMFNLSGSHINYVVWSDVLLCPTCGNEIIFWDHAVDFDLGKVNESFYCNKCRSKLKKRECLRSKTIIHDECIGENIEISKVVPVLINYTLNRKRYNKKLDSHDNTILSKIDNIKIPYWYPTDKIPNGYNTEQPKKSHGISHIHHFYTKRNLYINSVIMDKICNVDDKRIRDILLFGFNNVQQRHCRLNAMRFNVSFPSNITSGTLFIPSLMRENNIFDQLRNKYFRRILPILKHINGGNVIISTNSSTDQRNIPSSSIDYIFTDPPFGDNLNYSELNFIWECWIKTKTNNINEAIVNKVQKKGLVEYQELISKCFQEYYRILKPNRWITIEFHNSKNAVWNAIQEAINKAGFIIADVRILDKQQGSFKQVTTNSAVKQDLVISAYKPDQNFRRIIFNHVGSEESAWNFVREHLMKLPIVVNKNGTVEIIKERENFLLYDRMVAYHIINGVSVPIDASEFYRGLDEKFIKRDGMYFLQDQINEYDNVRLNCDIEPIQFSLFVNNEKNAIAWLYKELEKPQTYAEIQPKFMKELRANKHEKMPELSELLEENFIRNEKGEWYIPDATKLGDIVKLREKRLIKEFEEYLNGKGKLKSFRTEAVRAGFAKLWKEKDYKNIVKVADRLPESVIQEDDKLLMYYDISLSRIE